MPVSTVTSENRPGSLRTLWLRFEHLVRELGKFGVVGGSAFLLDLLLFNLFLDSVGVLWAKIISTGFSASAAFIGNRYWTWRDRPRNALHREYLLYFVFNAVGLGIAEACLYLSHYGLGAYWPSVFQTRLADNISTQIIGTIVGTLFRFWGYRRFVFPAPKETTIDESVVNGPAIDESVIDVSSLTELYQEAGRGAPARSDATRIGITTGDTSA